MTEQSRTWKLLARLVVLQRHVLFVDVVLPVLIVLSVALLASGQTDPRTLPLWDEQITRLGSFGLPDADGAGGWITYGGRLGALGVAVDGKRLYISCSQIGPTGPFNTNAEGWAILTIPSLGQKAQVLQPCAGLGKADIATVHPDPTAWRPQWGGVVEHNGRLAVVGMIEYDASGSTTASHWTGTSFISMVGPFRLTDPAPRTPEHRIKTGMVKSSQSRIPVEWRSLLGGDTIATAGYASIVSRASQGPNAVVYTLADVVKNDAPAKMLLGCPQEIASCVTYGTPTSLTRFNGSEQSGGSFIVPGTRTFAAIEREADGPTCYGYATRNQAEHGLPYLDAVYCYSLSDPLSSKGPKGYPYRLVAKLYDLNEFVAVKEGKKHPWDIIVPYAVVTLPGSTAGTDIYGGSGTFNDATGEYYLNHGHYGDNTQVAVYRFSGSGTPPPPPTPPTVTLTTAPPIIERGQSTQVCWTSTNATSGTLAPDADALLPLTGGCVAKSPTSPTTYIATVVGTGGSATAQASVQIAEPPPPPPPPPTLLIFDVRCKADPETGIVTCDGKRVPPPGGGQ